MVSRFSLINRSVVWHNRIDLSLERFYRRAHPLECVLCNDNLKEIQLMEKKLIAVAVAGAAGAPVFPFSQARTLPSLREDRPEGGSGGQGGKKTTGKGVEKKVVKQTGGADN